VPIHIVRTAHTTPARSVRHAHDDLWIWKLLNDGKTWDPDALIHALPPGLHFIDAFSVFFVVNSYKSPSIHVTQQADWAERRQCPPFNADGSLGFVPQSTRVLADTYTIVDRH